MDSEQENGQLEKIEQTDALVQMPEDRQYSSDSIEFSEESKQFSKENVSVLEQDVEESLSERSVKSNNEAMQNEQSHFVYNDPSLDMLGHEQRPSVERPSTGNNIFTKKRDNQESVEQQKSASNLNTSNRVPRPKEVYKNSSQEFNLDEEVRFE